MWWFVTTHLLLSSLQTRTELTPPAARRCAFKETMVTHLPVEVDTDVGAHVFGTDGQDLRNGGTQALDEGRAGRRDEEA